MKLFSTILALAFSATLFGQGITEKVHSLEQVRIIGNIVTEKESAGMQQIRIDSISKSSHATESLKQLLSYHSTIHIKDYGRGALATASFRGTAPSHTTVSWNGIPINSPMLGMVDLSLVPVFVADKFSIYPGSSSITNHSGGLGGAIELKSGSANSDRPTSMSMAELGSFGTVSLLQELSLSGGGLNSRTKAYYLKSDNDYPFLNRNILERDPDTGELFHPEQLNRDADYAIRGVIQEFYFRLAPERLLSNKTWVQEANRSIPTVLSSEFSEATMQRTTHQLDRSLRNVTEARIYAGSFNLTLLSALDLQGLNYSMKSNIAGAGENANVLSTSIMRGWVNRFRVESKGSDIWSIHLEGSHDRYSINTLDSVKMNGYDQHRNSTNLFGGVYLDRGAHWKFSGQLRTILISGEQIPLIYSLGSDWLPLKDETVVVKLNFSRNFHLPSLNDLYWVPGGNPDLLPEKGHTAELSIHHQLPGKQLRLWNIQLEQQLTGYLSRVDDWIQWVPGARGYWTATNIREVQTHGMEYQGKIVLEKEETRLNLSGTFSLGETLDLTEIGSAGELSSGKQLPYIPRLTGNLLAAIQHKGAFLVFQHQTTGMRYLLSSNSYGLDDDSGGILNHDVAGNFYSLYPHFLNHLSGGMQFPMERGRLTLELKVNNLLNEQYRNILNRFMPGRSWSLNLKLELN